MKGKRAGDADRAASLSTENGGLPLPTALDLFPAALTLGAWKFNLTASLHQGPRQRWRWGTFYNANKMKIPLCTAPLPQRAHT